MKNVIIIILAITAVVLGYVFLTPTNHPLGNAITQGIVPTFATSNAITVGPQNIQTLASRASNCVSRTISTSKGAVMLSFGGITPTGSVGHWQAASTTVSYDNANFGCGSITAYGYASTTVTVTAFKQ